eukprot:GHUV01045088.1.p1 GENE.GHUV01045088.1~~GHUV01045088.1.p1  ORF type:complete len:146 (-),score=30.07 GHUV01045088.1:141-578(-)
MAKSKNHTAHNQSKKAHRNGIKRPQKHKYTSRKGVSAPASPVRLLVAAYLHLTSCIVLLPADGPQVPAQPGGLRLGLVVARAALVAQVLQRYQTMYARECPQQHQQAYSWLTADYSSRHSAGNSHSCNVGSSSSRWPNLSREVIL